jgi:class 3 adenylate cyclase
MGKVVIKDELVQVEADGKKEKIWLITNEKLNNFNPKVLGLGDISLPSAQVEAIAAVFDLSEFTKFCSQIDPHLAVPEFLHEFLEWLFEMIKIEFVKESYPPGKTTWADLPFLAKFLGDGVLFLWNTDGMQSTSICNVVVALSNICMNYRTKFYPKIRKTVVEPPGTLRCGVARGKVFSVGNAEDYVGPCINIASRLQKLSRLTFCVSRRGFDFKRHMDDNEYQDYLLKSVPLRGIGNDELVWVRKTEFIGLPIKEQDIFKEP